METDGNAAVLGLGLPLLIRTVQDGLFVDCERNLTRYQGFLAEASTRIKVSVDGCSRLVQLDESLGQSIVIDNCYHRDMESGGPDA